jgi:hypothetical protein
MGSYEKIEGDETSETGTGSVRLMTVHKSKGLEFPVVLVADCATTAGDCGTTSPSNMDREYGVVVNLRREEASRKQKPGNWFFERAKEEERERDLAELRRLLYVPPPPGQNGNSLSSASGKPTPPFGRPWGTSPAPNGRNSSSSSPGAPPLEMMRRPAPSWT